MCITQLSLHLQSQNWPFFSLKGKKIIWESTDLLILSNKQDFICILESFYYLNILLSLLRKDRSIFKNYSVALFQLFLFSTDFIHFYFSDYLQQKKPLTYTRWHTLREWFILLLWSSPPLLSYLHSIALSEYISLWSFKDSPLLLSGLANPCWNELRIIRGKCRSFHFDYKVYIPEKRNCLTIYKSPRYNEYLKS